jgi:hypothetical protein
MGLVPKNKHRQQIAQRAADKAKKQQNRFGYAPILCFCPKFICPKQGKGKNVNYNIVRV